MLHVSHILLLSLHNQQIQRFHDVCQVHILISVTLMINDSDNVYESNDDQMQHVVQTKMRDVETE